MNCSLLRLDCISSAPRAPHMGGQQQPQLCQTFSLALLIWCGILFSLNQIIFRAKHTGAKIHISSKNHMFKNLNFHKIHIFKVSFVAKFTISKPHFSQNSHFQSLIFQRIHNFKVSFFTKFTISESYFS